MGLKVSYLKDFPNDKQEKIDLFNYRNQYIKDVHKIDWNRFQEYKEIDTCEFFKLVFGRSHSFNFEELNINSLELPFEYNYGESYNDDNKEYVYNNIAIEINKQKDKRNHNWIITKDLSALDSIIGKDFVITGPVTYVGRNRNGNNARFLYAFTIDLDYMMENEIRDLLYQNSKEHNPAPNIIVNSGNGCHLYYILKQPVPLFKENMEILDKLKEGLTSRVWNEFTSCDKTIQFQNVLQGYRIPGTKTKLGTDVSAFVNIKSSYFDLFQLNSFLYESQRLDEKDLKNIYYSLNSTYAERKEKRLKEIAEKWPEWYNRVIVNGEKSTYSVVKKDLYNWWLRKCKEGKEIKVGHRYYCALALVSFATKCNVPYEEVKADLYSCLDLFDEKTFQDENHFLPEDIEDALKLYGNPIAHRFKREYISKQTSIEIKKNKRNGRTRENHLLLLNQMRKIKGELEGYPKHKQHYSKEKEILLDFLKENPFHELNTSELSKKLNISRTTINKWTNKCNEEIINLNPNLTKEILFFNSTQKKIYNYLKNNLNKKPTINKLQLSKQVNIGYPSVLKYYDEIKEIVEQELAFESIFEEDENDNNSIKIKEQ